MVMSVGFVVNSYYVDKGTHDDYYSEALDYSFKRDGSDFDGISTTKPEGYLPPGNQFWDGLIPEEKQKKILVATDLDIKKKANIITGTNQTEKDVKGIKFYQEHPDDPEKVKTDLATTDNGKATILLKNLESGNSNLVEGYNPQGIIDGNTKTFNPKQTPIYVDPQIRFLGEVKGEDLIKGNLRTSIENEYAGNNLVKQIINTENIWLKIYDKKERKVLYISKTPIGNKTTWDELYKSKVVYGIGKDSKLKYDNGVIFKTKKETNDTNWIKPMRVRLLRGYNDFGVDNLDFKEITKKVGIENNLKITRDSEWNRYILPLIGENRYSDDSKNLVEQDLKELNLSNYKYKMANYKWSDLNIDASSENLLQEKNSARGNNTDATQIKDTLSSGDFRPVLEYLGCYDEACFEGEVAGTEFITYRELLEKIEGKSYEKFDKNIRTVKNKDGKDVQVEVKKTKVGEELYLGNDTETGGNWLKIIDYKGEKPKTLYISKKPITNYVSWNKIKDAGAMYGLDQMTEESIKTYYETKKLIPKNGRNYTPTIITNPKTNKAYIVRLLKTSTQSNPDTPIEAKFSEYQKSEKLKNSEWSRYMLPLIKEYRYTGNTIKSVPEELTKIKDKNETVLNSGQLSDSQEFKYQLAEYNWFGDLTLRPSQDEFKYQGKTQEKDTSAFYKDDNENTLSEYVGQLSWVQEYAESYAYRALRGNNNTSNGAAYANSNYPDYFYDYYGFRPVLEEIPNY